MMRDAVKLEQKSFGPEEPSLLISVNNLAVLEFGVGHYAEAEKLSFATWERMTHNFGSQHYTSLTCLETYGMCLLL